MDLEEVIRRAKTCKLCGEIHVAQPSKYKNEAPSFAHPRDGHIYCLPVVVGTVAWLESLRGER